MATCQYCGKHFTAYWMGSITCDKCLQDRQELYAEQRLKRIEERLTQLELRLTNMNLKEVK